jgi:hypothetical protein
VALKNADWFWCALVVMPAWASVGSGWGLARRRCNRCDGVASLHSQSHRGPVPVHDRGLAAATKKKAPKNTQEHVHTPRRPQGAGARRRRDPALARAQRRGTRAQARAATRNTHAGAVAWTLRIIRSIDRVERDSTQRHQRGAHTTQRRAHNTYSAGAGSRVIEETRVAVTAVPSTLRLGRGKGVVAPAAVCTNKGLY